MTRAHELVTSGSAADAQAVRRRETFRQRATLLALLAGVIVVDQAGKWWGWRHVPGAHINPGGDFLTGPTVGRWYAEPVAGALLDLFDFALLSAVAVVLGRRRRPAAVTVCGALMLGGWASNLLDRLGTHYWTAPGSVRGVVDFITIGPNSYNLADFFIMAGTPLFLLTAAYLRKRGGSRPPAARAATSPPRHRSGAWKPVGALAGTGVILAVALGAAHHGRLIRPSHVKAERQHRAGPSRLNGAARISGPAHRLSAR